MNDHTILSHPVDLSQMSVKELGGLYRLLYHTEFAIARALAGYCPLIEPLDSKWALIEIVYTLMKHAAGYYERLPEVRVPSRLSGVPSEEIYKTTTTLSCLPSWESALGWCVHQLLPKLTTLCQEAYHSTNGTALVHDRRLFMQVCADLAKLQTLAGLESLPVTGFDMPPFELKQIPPMLPGDTETGAIPLQIPSCAKRVYPKEARFTSEKLNLAFPPDTPEKLAAFLHDNMQIEFVAIDIPFRNIAEFAGLPFQFYMDMARHTHDEMRHTQMLLEDLAGLGYALGDFLFESPDRYETMAEQDLIYRLVILSRTGEGEAIDVINKLQPELEKAGFAETAVKFDHVLSDEVRHTLYGNKWIRYLVGESDARIAEVTWDCLNRYNKIAKAIGLPKKPRDPDYLNVRRPFGVDAFTREMAGFTPSELEVMLEVQKK